MLEFSSGSVPTARKEHTCDLCNGFISVGEKYVRFAGKFDGFMFDTKHHLLCSSIIDEYCEWACDNEYDNDAVIDWLRETVCGGCEHSWYGDGNDDCDAELFLCQRVIARFKKKDGDGNGTEPV